MAAQEIAPWLTGLQVVALLATADVECAAEYLRRQGERRVNRKVATTLPTCDAREKPPPLNSAQRVEAFKGELWDWGGPSLHVLIMQCGDAGLVERALDILNQWAPRLHCVDEHSNAIAPQLLTTHCIKEHPEDSGFLRLVLLGNEHRGGPVPSFRTSDVLALICESLTADPQFHAVVGLADKLSARSLEQSVACELKVPDGAPQEAETVLSSTAIAEQDPMGGLEPSSGAPTLTPGPERRRGRRPVWNWDGAKAAFAAFLARDPDGLPQIQADAERWVANWFAANNNGDSPPISEIWLRVVAPVYGAARSTSAAP